MSSDGPPPTATPFSRGAHDTSHAIRVAHLGKQYQLGQRATHRTLREALVEGMRGVARSIGRSGASRAAERFWALDDVTFDVAHGDVVGIIGRNGSGKSTLLKILSRIVEPTTGVVDLEGRVGSLLEVGTGFHPDLTGRENVYLSGAILGMRRTEIAKKFDEIVDFAEVDRFIDTQVKHYSSGMYMRLAFSVAAHLEPDILVVDEVLAVGDAAFQKKCLGKMGTVARHGRTVLFVSHNMGAVVSLCSRALLLDGGRLVLDSDPITVAAKYQATLTAAPTATTGLAGAEHFGSGKARFVSLRFVPERRDGTTREMMCPGSRLRVETRVVCSAPVDSANVGITIYDASGYRLVDANTAMQGRFVSMQPGDEARVEFTLDDLRLKPGTYLVGLWMGRGNIEDIDGVLYAATLEVEPDPQQLQHSEQFPGSYLCAFRHSVAISAASSGVDAPGVLKERDAQPDPQRDPQGAVGVSR
jgi:lipopolysaccharide transport system ATP-binding protein